MILRIRILVKPTAGNAVFDVNFSLSQGMIPPEYQNLESLSDLANVVLTGESYLNRVGSVKNEGLVTLGKRFTMKCRSADLSMTVQ